MTILNVHLEQRRALVASNTAGVFPDGSPGNVSKIFAIPHASSVVAGRGQIGIIFHVYGDCHRAMTDFDGMASRLARSLQAHYLSSCREARRQGVSVSLDTEVVLVGWSRSESCMSALYCRVNDDGSVFQEEKEWIVCPWEANWGEVPTLSASIADMVSVSRLQAQHAERGSPGMGWQGDLTLCEITPESITFTAVKDFCK